MNRGILKRYAPFLCPCDTGRGIRLQHGRKPQAERLKLHTIMKTIRIITGLLAIYALILGLVVLFKQPFHTNQTNDNVFCTMFGIGMTLVLIFLKLENNKKDERDFNAR
jgi:hypothetical protein